MICSLEFKKNSVKILKILLSELMVSSLCFFPSNMRALLLMKSLCKLIYGIRYFCTSFLSPQLIFDDLTSIFINRPLISAVKIGRERLTSFGKMVNIERCFTFRY